MRLFFLPQLAMPLILLFVVVGAVVGWMRRRDHLAMMLVVGSIITFLTSTVQNICFVILRVEWMNLRTAMINGVAGILGELIFGIGLLWMMLSQPREGRNQG